MATTQQTTDPSRTEPYECDRCGAPLTSTDGTWQCGDCHHAPRHGAD